MAEKRVARHRAAKRPSTPVTVALKSLADAEPGRKMIAATGSGVALTVIAAGVAPSISASNVEPSGVVDTAKVVSVAVSKASVNPVVKAEKEDVINNLEGDISVAAKKVAKKEEKPARVAENRTRSASNTRSTSKPAPAQKQAPAKYTGSSNSDVVAIAGRYLGHRYVWGGTSPSTGFDCSGYVSYVYRQVGINIPHSSRAIGRIGKKLPLSAAQPGDILWRNGHVGIYIGNGKMMHANHPGGGTVVAPISHSRFTNVIRVK